MRIAAFSDIHGNLEALVAVLEASRLHSPDLLLCLGDIVGYGANPRECVAELRRSGAVCLAGNHDHAACGLLDPTGFNGFAREAIGWTAEQLTRQDHAFLQRLPLIWSEGPLTAVHATIIDPDAFAYVVDDISARELVQAQPTALCIAGHSHVPWAWEIRNGELIRSAPAAGQLPVGERSLMNIGSVGQPRDGDTDACYALIDTESLTLTLHRIAYEVGRAAAKIRQAGLPELLAARLFLGR